MQRRKIGYFFSSEIAKAIRTQEGMAGSPIQRPLSSSRDMWRHASRRRDGGPLTRLVHNTIISNKSTDNAVSRKNCNHKDTRFGLVTPGKTGARSAYKCSSGERKSSNCFPQEDSDGIQYLSPDNHSEALAQP